MAPNVGSTKVHCRQIRGRNCNKRRSHHRKVNRFRKFMGRMAELVAEIRGVHQAIDKLTNVVIG